MKKHLLVMLSGAMLLSLCANVSGKVAPKFTIPEFPEFSMLIDYPGAPEGKAIHLYTKYNGKLYDIKATPPVIYGLGLTRRTRPYVIAYRCMKFAQPPYSAKIFKGDYTEGKNLPSDLLKKIKERVKMERKRLQWWGPGDIIRKEKK